MNLLHIYLNIYNKINTSVIIIYVLFLSMLLLFYLFYVSSNNFFKIIINLLYIFNIAVILSYHNVDFFSALLLSAELPLILVLIIFYFHKNSLEIDSIYKYKTNNKVFSLFICLSFMIFIYMFCFITPKLNISFYNFLVNDSVYISNKNDFLILFILLYKINNLYVLLFAFLIFLVSLLVILIYQLNKLLSFQKNYLKKNVSLLRKQNLLKQSIYNSKLKFFNKKI